MTSFNFNCLLLDPISTRGHAEVGASAQPMNPGGTLFSPLPAFAELNTGFWCLGRATVSRILRWIDK